MNREKTAQAQEVRQRAVNRIREVDCVPWPVILFYDYPRGGPNAVEFVASWYDGGFYQSTSLLGATVARGEQRLMEWVEAWIALHAMARE